MHLWGRVAGLLAVVCCALASAGAADADAFERAKEGLAELHLAALVRAVEDLQASYPGKYPDGAAMLKQLRAFDKDALARYSGLAALRQKALLSNPLLDFEQMAGFQMFAAKLDDEMLACWNAPCNTPALTVA
jgi:hypothetical protein